MIGTIVTAMATDTADARLRQAELDDQHDVDEQAGQDLGQGRHRLDHGAHQLRSPPPTSIM